MFNDLIRELQRLERGVRASTKVPLDEKGYIDRQCPSESCHAVFKIMFEDWRDKVRDDVVYCPLCRYEARSTEWNTATQIEYISSVGRAHLMKLLNKAIRSDVREFNRRQPKKGFVQMSMSYKPGTPPSIVPIEAADAMQQDFVCESCACCYASIGAAFFCPACGYNSATTTFDTAIETVVNTLKHLASFKEALIGAEGLDAAEDVARDILETRLDKLVGSFQRFAEATFQELPNAGQFKLRKNVFQRLPESSELWRQAIGKGYEDMLTPSEWQEISRLFQQRHLLAHCEGIVDQEYIDKTGDTTYSVGQRIVVKEEAVLRLADLVRKLGNELSPPKPSSKRITPPKPRAVADRLTTHERDLLLAAAHDGEFLIIETDQEGRWIRAGGRDFIEEGSPTAAATYLEALVNLWRRTYASRESEHLYVLTDKGWGLVAKLGK